MKITLFCLAAVSTCSSAFVLPAVASPKISALQATVQKYELVPPVTDNDDEAKDLYDKFVQTTYG